MDTGTILQYISPFKAASKSDSFASAELVRPALGDHFREVAFAVFEDHVANLRLPAIVTDCYCRNSEHVQIVSSKKRCDTRKPGSVGQGELPHESLNDLSSENHCHHQHELCSAGRATNTVALGPSPSYCSHPYEQPSLPRDQVTAGGTGVMRQQFGRWESPGSIPDGCVSPMRLSCPLLCAPLLSDPPALMALGSSTDNFCSSGCTSYMLSQDSRTDCATSSNSTAPPVQEPRSEHKSFSATDCNSTLGGRHSHINYGKDAVCDLDASTSKGMSMTSMDMDCMQMWDIAPSDMEIRSYTADATLNQLTDAVRQGIVEFDSCHDGIVFKLGNRVMDASLKKLLSDGPAAVLTILTDKDAPRHQMKAASYACALLAHAGVASELVQADVFLPLVRLLKSKDSSCRGNALQALNGLLENSFHSNPQPLNDGCASSRPARDLVVAYQFCVEAKGSVALLEVLENITETSHNIQAALSVLRTLVVNYGHIRFIPKMEAYVAVTTLVCEQAHAMTHAAVGDRQYPHVVAVDAQLLGVALHTVNAMLISFGPKIIADIDDSIMEPAAHIFCFGEIKSAALAASILLQFSNASDSIKVKVVQCNVVPSIVRLLRSAVDVQFIDVLLTLLRDVATCGATRPFLEGAELLNAIVGLLEWSTDVEVLCRTTLVLAEVVNGGPEAQSRATDAGALEAILSLLSMEPCEFQLVACLVIALLALLNGHPGNCYVAQLLQIDEALEKCLLETTDIELSTAIVMVLELLQC